MSGRMHLIRTVSENRAFCRLDTRGRDASSYGPCLADVCWSNPAVCRRPVKVYRSVAGHTLPAVITLLPLATGRCRRAGMRD